MFPYPCKCSSSNLSRCSRDFLRKDSNTTSNRGVSDQTPASKIGFANQTRHCTLTTEVLVLLVRTAIDAWEDTDEHLTGKQDNDFGKNFVPLVPSRYATFAIA